VFTKIKNTAVDAQAEFDDTETRLQIEQSGHRRTEATFRYLNTPLIR